MKNVKKIAKGKKKKKKKKKKRKEMQDIFHRLKMFSILTSMSLGL